MGVSLHFVPDCRPKTENYGIQSLRYLGPKIWNMLPKSLKESPSLYSFKSTVKTWTPDDCPCKLCKYFIPNVGYM